MQTWEVPCADGGTITVLPFLRSKYGYQLRNYHLKAIYGFNPKRRWPDGQHKAVMVGNVLVRLLPLWEAQQRSPLAKKPHRIMALCPLCPDWVPAGRLEQHLIVHGMKPGRDLAP